MKLLQVLVMPQQGREELTRNWVPRLAELKDIDRFFRQLDTLRAVILGEAGYFELRCMVDEDHARDVRLVSNRKCERKLRPTRV